MPPIPKQHGVWAAVLTNLILASTLFWTHWPTLLVLATGVIFLVFVQHALAHLFTQRSRQHSNRRNVHWFVIYSLCFLSTGLILFWHAQRPTIIWIGLGAATWAVIWAWVEAKRPRRTIGAEMLAFASVAFVLPLASWLSTEQITEVCWVVWALSSVFFAGSVLRVRYLAKRRETAWWNTWRGGLASLIVHLACLAITAWISALAGLGVYMALPLAPVTCSVAWNLVSSRGGTAKLRRIGLEELAHTIIFLGVALGVLIGEGLS